MQNKLSILAHVAVWSVFLFTPLIFIPKPDSTTLPTYYFYAFFIISNLSFVVYYYFNYYWVVPKYLFNKQYVIYALITLGCLALILLPTLFIRPIMMMSGIRKDFGTVGAEFIARHPTPRYLISPFFWNHIVIFLLISISSIGIRIMSKMQILEKEKLSVELLYLKAQINPHFLFNTLNTIYAMAIKQSDESTANAVVMLSDMMRFVITETHNEVVSLDKKLQYVQNYIELQKLRLGENMVLDYEVKGDPLGKKIAPMILMPFIENAFKHGTTKEKNFAISIKILITEKELWLEVENSKFTGHKIEEETKLGIDNTRKRLELLYSSKHKFEIIENDHNYRISLKLIIV